jgi:trans-aconitate methyltransferase
VLFSSFTENAFLPLAEIFIEDVQAAGVDLAQVPMVSARLKEAEICRELLAQAGFVNVQQKTVQMGYHLQDENAWWDVLWGAALRGVLELIPETQRSDFKQQHLARIKTHCSEKGLWLDVEVRLTMAEVAEKIAG